MAKKRSAGVQDTEIDRPNLCTFSDIVFQLLIFFMLTIQFADAAIEKLVLPTSSDPKKTKMNDPSLLIINVRKDGTIMIGGKIWYDSKWNTSPEKERGAFTKMEELFNKRRQMVKYQEVPGRSDTVKYFILIRADRSTDFEHVQRLLMMATRYGGVTKIMFATIGEKRT
jgi:biopolymer transport protein ExbD